MSRRHDSAQPRVRGVATWRSALVLWSVAVLALATGCQNTPTSQPTVASTVVPSSSEDTTDPSVGYTLLSPDGNRVVAGRGDLPNVTAMDIPLDGVPLWLVSAPLGEGSVWVAVQRDGRVQAFQAARGEAAVIAITPDLLPSGARRSKIDCTACLYADSPCRQGRWERGLHRR